MKLMKINILIGFFVLAIAAWAVIWFSGDSSQSQPPPQAPPSAKKKMAGTGDPGYVVGSFELKVNLPLNAVTTVQYVIPLDRATGKPKATASNMVFYAPYNGDAEKIRQGLKKWHRHYSDVLGFTVFSLSIEANKDIVDDRKQYYIYQEAGWYEVIFRIKQHLEREFNLSDRPLLVVGESSGGSMAQQMAAAYPEKIAAAAWCGGSKYVEFSKPCPTAFLALNTWGCYGIPATRKFVDGAERSGIQVLRGEGPPVWRPGKLYHHAPGPQLYELMHTFIADVVALRDQNGGVVPGREQWPSQADVGGETQYYPSGHFRELWLRLPHAMREKLAAGKSDLLEYPPLAEPRGVVLLVYEKTADGKLLLEDSLYYLTQERYAAFAVMVGEAPLAELRTVQEALKEILDRDEFKSLPVLLVGNGIGGSIAAMEASRLKVQRISRVVMLNTSVSHALPELSIVENRRSSSLDLDMYYFGNPPEITLNHTRILNLPDSGNPEKNWFNFLEAAVK